MKVPVTVRYRRLSKPAIAWSALAIGAVVAAAVLWAVFGRSGGAATALPTPIATCTGLAPASCAKVQAEVVQFIGPSEHAITIDISTNSICLGDPFHPISCPLDSQYFASGIAQLGDGQWAFVNLFAAPDGSFRTDGRILAAPPGWTPY